MPPAKGTRRSPAKKETTTPLTDAQRQKYAVLNAIASGRSSAFMSRMGGTQFAGKRDIFAAAGYIKHGAVTFEDYFALYTRGDIAGRIVDMPAKTTWRQPPDITEPEAELTGDKDERKDVADQTKFTEQFHLLAKRLKLWEYVTRLDQLAGIGRYAVMLLGVKGTDDAMLKEELTSVQGPDDIIYLSVYHEKHARIVEWELNPGNARFGMPKLYELTVVSPEAVGNTGASAKPNIRVHASRLIHVAENLLDDDVFGRPRLERALNRLTDLEKISASTGESYWQLTSRILQAKIDPEAEITEKQFAELDEKLGDLVHDLKRQFYGQGVELGWLDSQTPNVDQVGDFYFSLIAGASGIPKRILFGSELGELASTTDEATYFGSIEERRAQFANTQIIAPLLDKLIGIKALPKPSSGEYSIVWSPLNVESPTQKASASLTRAQTAMALTPVGGNPKDLVYIDENGEVWLKTDEEDDVTKELDDLDALEDELERSGGAPLPIGERPLTNGAQVSSILKLVDSVSSGVLPKSTAMAIVVASFPDLTPEQVENIFRDIVEGKRPATADDPNAPAVIPPVIEG